MDAALGLAPVFVSPRHADLDIPGAVREVQTPTPGTSPWRFCSMAMQAAMQAQGRELAREPGVACFDSMDEAIMGLAATWRYRQLPSPAAPGFQPAPAFRLSARWPCRPRGGVGGRGGLEDFAGLRFPLGPRGPGRRRCRGRGRGAGAWATRWC